MIGQVSSNVEKLATRTDAVIVQRILSEMEQFDFDVQEMDGFLAEISPDLSLEANGRGTHFYILPAVETLKQDVELDAKETEDISKLRRQLFGFTNTMTPEEIPLFRRHFVIGDLMIATERFLKQRTSGHLKIWLRRTTVSGVPLMSVDFSEAKFVFLIRNRWTSSSHGQDREESPRHAVPS